MMEDLHLDQPEIRSQASYRDLMEREEDFTEWDSASVMMANEQLRPKEYRCLLCGSQSHFWRSCVIYKQQSPVKEVCATCGYRHQRQVCKTPEPRPGHVRPTDQKREQVQVYS